MLNLEEKHQRRDACSSKGKNILGQAFYAKSSRGRGGGQGQGGGKGHSCIVQQS